MKMMKRLLLAIMLVVLCCALAACQKDAPEATNTNAAVATNAPAAAGNPNDVMVTVGDVKITRAEYEDALATLTNYYASYGYDMSEPSLAALVKQYALQTCVEYAAMDLKLVALGLDLTQEEKDAAIAAAQENWNATIEDGLAYYGITAESTEEERGTTLVKVLAELESMGYTQESYKEDGLKYAGYDKLFAYATEGVTVTDEEIVNYYNSLVESDKALYENDAAAYEQAQYMNQMYAAYGMSEYVTEIFYKPAGYRLVTHILLEADEALLTAYVDLQAAYEEQQNTIEEGGEVTEALITAEEVENARLAILNNVQPKVDEINQKMSEGATFAELIPLYTTDPGMSDEVSIAAGYEVHMDSTNWVIPFRDQAFTVDNIGDVTAPVVTDYGVHILQYVADVPAGAVELTDAMKADFHESLLSSAQDEVYYAAIEQWVSEVNAVYSEEAQAIIAAAQAAE